MTKANPRDRIRETAGSRALGVLCVRHGPTAIAKRIGVTPKAIHYLATGKRVPSGPTRTKLAKLYDLGIELWSEKPSASVPFEPLKLEETRSTVLEAEANLAAAKATRDRALSDPAASHRDRSSAAAAVDRAIRSLADARGEDEISEARLANSDAFQRFVARAVSKLKSVPGALTAWAQACEAQE